GDGDIDGNRARRVLPRGLSDGALERPITKMGGAVGRRTQHRSHPCRVNQSLHASAGRVKAQPLLPLLPPPPLPIPILSGSFRGILPYLRKLRISPLTARKE